MAKTIPAKQKLTIYQGATFSKTVAMTDDADAPIDLTGATARMQIRRSVSSDTVLLELTTENGRISHDGAGGVLTLVVDDEDTAALSFGNAVYDLEIEYGNGQVDRALYGDIILSKEVTRPPT